MVIVQKTWCSASTFCTSTEDLRQMHEEAELLLPYYEYLLGAIMCLMVDSIATSQRLLLFTCRWQASLSSFSSRKGVFWTISEDDRMLSVGELICGSAANKR